MTNSIYSTLTAILLASIFLVGCTGKFHVVELTDKENTETTRGIPVRFMETQKEWFSYTTVRQLDGINSPNCKPMLLLRFVDAPTDKKYRIYYESVGFEKNKIKITLNPNGTLGSVDSESTPVSLAEVTKFVGDLSKLVDPAGKVLGQTEKDFDKSLPKEKSTPLCNAKPEAIFERCSVNEDCKPTDDVFEVWATEKYSGS